VFVKQRKVTFVQGTPVKMAALVGKVLMAPVSFAFADQDFEAISVKLLLILVGRIPA